MGLLGGILMSPVTGPVKGLGFVLEQLKKYVEQEMYDISKLQNKLVQARMSFERGRISQEEYNELETDLLARLKVARQRQKQKIMEAARGLEGVNIDSLGGIQVLIEGDEDEDEANTK